MEPERSASAPPKAPLGAPAASRKHASYLFLVIVTVVNLVADLASKWWAKATFEGARGDQRRVPIVDGVMNFMFARNKGGAWGLLQNEDEVLRRAFFITVSVAAIVFIVSLYRKLQPGQRALKRGLPLVLGGALGNLVDRIRYGWVVDFIDVYVTIGGSEKHWPTFNVADIAICIGVGLMAIDLFTSRSPEQAALDKAEKAASSDAASGGGVSGGGVSGGGVSGGQATKAGTGGESLQTTMISASGDADPKPTDEGASGASAERA
jgi:signal peptidase II